ncbi:MAG: hypothetical protein AAF066_03145 [Pseudomonadota bacterium]
MTTAPIDQEKPRQARLSAQLPPTMRMPVGHQSEALNQHREALEKAGSFGTAIIDIATRSADHARDDWNRIDTTENTVKAEVGNKIKAGLVPVEIVRKDGQNFAVDGRFVELCDAAAPVLQRRMAAHGENMDRVITNMRSLEKQMDDALVCDQTKADAPLRSDIRSHIRQSDNPAATALEAARLGDKSFIATILGSSPALLGLTPADVDDVRDVAKRALSPDTYAAHQAGEKVLQSMMVLGKSLDEKRLSLSGYQMADKRMADEALAALRKPKAK